MVRTRVGDVRLPAVASRPILSNEGRVLLREGIPLTSAALQSLQNMKVSHIWLYDPRLEDVEVSDLFSETSKRRFMSIFDTVCRDISHDNLTTIAKVVKSESLIEMIRETNIYVGRWIPALEDGDNYEPLITHSIRVCLFVLAIGSRLYSRDSLMNLVIGALFHDIGHLHHPSWERMQPDELDRDNPKHQQKGFDFLLKARRLSATTAAICIQHHERIDGMGKPRGLYENSIHAYARLTAVADQFDTLAFGSKKPDPREAIRRLQEESGVGLDPYFVQLFLSRVNPFPPGVPLTLKSGNRAVVVRSNPDHVDRPFVRVLLPDNQARDLDLSTDWSDSIEAASWSNPSAGEEALR